MSVIRRTQYIDKDFYKFFNGTFKESFDATVSSNGTTVTMTLVKTGGGNLTCQWSDGNSTFDTSANGTITLTAGSDASPTENYIYILQTDKNALVRHGSSWPSAEHIKIAYFLCASAAEVQADGGTYINQNWNDHLSGTDNMGHLTHIGKWIRRSGARYFSGINPNGTSDYLTISGGTISFNSTSGVVSQHHEHTFPAKHIAAGQDDAHIVNYSGAAYTKTTNLYNQVNQLSDGTPIGTGKWFNFVVWAVANKTGEYEPLMINLPSGVYNNQSDAEADADGYTDYSIPRQYNLDSGTGFLICRITVRKDATTWTYGSYLDLRGQTPTTATGASGSAITDFADNTFTVYDADDITRIIDFDAGSITTGNTRTITMADVDIDLADIVTNNAKVTNATHTGDVTGDTALTIAVGAVDIAMLSATGTPSSSTYLRGDNTWATVDLSSYLPLAGGTMTGNIAFDDLTDTIAGIQNQNLLDKTATEDITGQYDFSNVITSTPDLVSGASSVIDITPNSYTFGAAKGTRLSGIALNFTMTDASITGTFGALRGIVANVTNTNASVNRTSAGTPSCFEGALVSLHEDAWNGIRIAASSASGTPNISLQTGIYATATGDNASTSTQGGLYAARFDGTNASTTGWVKGFSGYALQQNAAPAGKEIAVLGITGPGTGGTHLKYGYLFSPGVNVNARTYGVHSSNGVLWALNGQVWISNTLDYSSTNPSTHLTVTNTSNDLFVGEELEVDGKAWFDGEIEIADAKDIVLNTTTGTKIGTATNQKLSFFNATPIIQQTTTSQTAATFTANSSGISDDTATWNGYTMGDVVAILQAFGLLQ